MYQGFNRKPYLEEQARLMSFIENFRMHEGRVFILKTFRRTENDHVAGSKPASNILTKKYFDAIPFGTLNPALGFFKIKRCIFARNVKHRKE